MRKRLMACFCSILLFASGCSGENQEDHRTEALSMTSLIEETVIVSESEVESETSNHEEVTTVSRLPVETPILFSIQLIDDQMAQTMTGNSFHENQHIQLEDLRLVAVGYYGFDGENHQGSIVVHKVIAEDILAIFQELFDAQYPIESLEPIDAYGGDDDASMVANNSSGFNYRVVAGTDRLSRHAYGLAVDINPLINPWVTSSGVYPPEGTRYADRTLDQQGMIKEGDACYTAFTSRGFEWGGHWNSSKDYQHFDCTIDGINQ